MCVIVYNKPGVLLSKETVEACAKTNSDGMGMVIAAEGKLHIHKEMSNVDGFYEFYSMMRERYPESKIVLHFRISTQGGVRVENNHPFLVTENVAFAHNGVISGMGYDGFKSDTRIYNDKILKSLPENFYKNKTILKMMAAFTGSYNKFVFMDKDGYVMILGENKGDWDDKKENWYSNMHWKYRTSEYGGRYGKTAYADYGYGWGDDDYRGMGFVQGGGYAKTQKETQKEQDEERHKKFLKDGWELNDKGLWVFTGKKHKSPHSLND